MDRYIRTQIKLRDSIEAQSRISHERELSQTQVNEAKLRWQWLESVLSTIPASLVILDSEQNILQANPASVDLMGYSSEQLVGMPISSLLETEEELQEFDSHLHCKDGSTIPVSTSIASVDLLSSSSEAPGAVLIIHDLRERISMEQERASQANQLAYQSGLSEMSANVLHNIGNTIGGMSWQVIALQNSIKHLQSIEQGLQHGSEVSNIEKLQHGLKRALSELNNLHQQELTVQAADIAKSIEYVSEVIRVQQSQAQAQNIYIKSFNLQGAIEDVLLIERETNRKHDITIQHKIPTGLEDASLPYNQFMQLLGNLIKNSREAIEQQRLMVDRPEYPGEVFIEIQPSDGGRFTLTIKDNGCGIEAEHLNSIFQRGVSQKGGGSGFGLHAAATFIQSLDGTIQAHSEGRGQGACISLELPIHVNSTTSKKKTHVL